MTLGWNIKWISGVNLSRVGWRFHNDQSLSVHRNALLQFEEITLPVGLAPNATIAVLGLGAMGSRIAKRLSDTGHKVIGWNRTSDERWPEFPVATSIPKTVESADLIILSVTDAIAVEEIIAQFPTRESDQSIVVMDMSTIGPESARTIAASIEKPYQYVDSPVLGTTTEADKGALKILLGGNSLDAALVRSILGEHLGEIHHVGEVGSGAAAKLVANFSLLAAVVAFGEAYALGIALGLPSSTLQDVISASPLGSQVNRRLPALLDRRFEKRFSLELALKDANVIAEQPQLLGTELHITKGIREWLTYAADSGKGQLDYTAVLATIFDTLVQPE